MTTPFSTADAIERLTAGNSLTDEQCRLAVGSILDGRTSEAATAAFLTALRVKGETGDELFGAVSAIRERMIAFDSGRVGCLDTCGTGGDGARTVNISTGAAVVLAACGVPVVKHGNRAASSSSGSSDVLSVLGVSIDAEPDVLRDGLEELGIAFLFAPRFHPGLRTVAAVRGQLPFRTIFNLVGPLCNPASPCFQLVGVPSETHAQRMADALVKTTSIRRAVVARGSDGLDEVTLGGTTDVILIEDGRTTRLGWTPDDFGLPTTNAEELRVESPAQSAEMLRRTFAGEDGPARRYILANAAAALWTVDETPLLEAVDRAAEAIESGKAAALLERWGRLTRGGG